MILYLMRRNLPSFTAALFSIFAAASFVATPRIAPVELLPFLIIIYIYGAMQRRGSSFEASLPIRGREIVAARVLWILALVWLPIVAWLFATIHSGARVFHVGMVLDTGAAFTLAVLLPYAVRPEELDGPPVWLTVLLWIALAAPSFAVAWFLPPAVSMATLAIAIFVAARWVWSRIPDSLEVAPRKALKAKPSDTATSRSATEPATSGHAWKPLLLALFQGWKNRSGNQSYSILFWYALFLLLGLTNENSFVALLYLVLPLSMARQGTRWLTAFPISNRARLWCVLVPGMFLALGFVGLGNIASSMFFRHRTSMSTNAPSGTHQRDDLTRVPLEFWRRAIGDPVITSPWGETAVADTMSVLHVELQNPYTTNTGSTPWFVEWQLQLATTAVYGHPMTVAIYRSRKAAGTLPPEVISSQRMQILNVMTIIGIALLLAILVELSQRYWLAGNRLSSYIVQSIFALVLLSPIAVDWIYAKYPISSVTRSIVEAALLRVSVLLPASLTALTMISALPLIALYAVLEWQFDSAESVEWRRSESRVGRFLARGVPNYHAP